jgi:hypothetical protein
MALAKRLVSEEVTPWNRIRLEHLYSSEGWRGRRVDLSLTNGSQLKGVEVVSAGRGGLSSLWIEIEGTDLIIDKAEIADICDVGVERAA